MGEAVLEVQLFLSVKNSDRNWNSGELNSFEGQVLSLSDNNFM